MSKKLKIPKPTKCYGYTGVWQDGSVGWMGVSHLGGSKKYPEMPNMSDGRYGILQDERLFLCEITVKPLLDKKGRPITKIIK
jgi:hypothetical protein